MPVEDIVGNRKRIIEELTATKRDGVLNLIGLLDKYGFFDAASDSHDASRGGTANHSLWTLWFARDKREAILRQRPEMDIPEESLTLICLCHDICNCTFPIIKGTSHGTRSREILRKSGCAFSEEELDAISSHSSDTLAGRSEISSADSPDMTSLLHYLVHSSDAMSVEFADSIPFSAQPEYLEDPLRKDYYTEVILNPDEHVMWIGAQDREDILENVKQLPQFPVHQICSLSIRPDSKDDDVVVLSDDNGLYAMAFLSEESCNGSAPVYRSDKVLFGYTDFIFRISRFPKYRSSYIIARNIKGRWGVYRIRENRKKNIDHKILIDRVVEFTYRYPEKASLSLRGHSRHLIGTDHPYFYQELHLKDSETYKNLNK